MNIGVDTNALVYAHVVASPHHEATRSYLDRALAEEASRITITPIVAHEFVHIVTDPRRFGVPMSMDDAMSTMMKWIARANVICPAINDEIVVRAFELLERHRLGRRRIIDTFLAATLLHHDVRTLITCDPTDFAIFEEIEVVDPRSAP